MEGGCPFLSRNFISLFIFVLKYHAVKCIIGLNQAIYDSSTPVYFTLTFLPENLVHFTVRGRIAVRLLPLHQTTRVSRTDEDSYQKADHGGININKTPAKAFTPLAKRKWAQGQAGL